MIPACDGQTVDGQTESIIANTALCIACYAERCISKTVQDRTIVTMTRLIGCRIRAFDWYQNHRPWMTLNDLERPKRSRVQKRCVFWSPLHKFE